MKSIILYFTLFLLVGVGVLSAQPYKSSVGIRLGQGTSITGKMFFAQEHALEAIVGVNSRGAGITGLYEKHAPAFGVPRLHWFFGVGGHVGYWNDQASETLVFDEESTVVAGIDGIVGLEYTIEAIPVSFSLDYKPLLNVAGNQDFIWAGGLSARLVF